MSEHRSLRVSPNGRYLVQPDGTPFFYLADTAWELFHRLSREEAVRYLRDRADKGFTAIQAVVLAELDGLNTANVAGHRPLTDNDPLKPNEPYFEDVDYIVQQAAAMGLFVAMLPTWGDKWKKDAGIGPHVFNPANAREYGRWLGRRYSAQPIIWVLGGDKLIDTDEERQTVVAMARGLREGDGGRHLISFHPTGQYSSAMYFHNEDWLDCNMVQTGHTRDRDNYNSVAAEYGRVPVKPVLDGEPGYENIGHAFSATNGRLDAHQARKFCYWSLFSGAFGHTYGCNDIWQMYAEGRQPVIGADTPWDRAMAFPGSTQMGHARRLIESGPYFDRLPDQSLIQPPNPDGPEHARACRAPDASYTLVYLPTARPVTVRVFMMLSSNLSATWFDPRTGERKPGAVVDVAPWQTHTFEPPSNSDWILELRRA